MSIESLKSISTQKVHKTCYKQGSILHFLGTNHSPRASSPISRRSLDPISSGPGIIIAYFSELRPVAGRLDPSA